MFSAKAGVLLVLFPVDILRDSVDANQTADIFSRRLVSEAAELL